MSAISIGKPVIIDGQEVIVVRDIVNRDQSNSKDSDYYAQVEGTGVSGRPEIYVAESDLARLRENYPGMNVYGLWQILFHNKAVTLGGQVIIYPLTQNAGMYLTLESGSDYSQASNITRSGEYADNFIVDFVEFDLADAIRIESSLTEMSLPDHPAYTRSELGEKKSAENRRKWLVTGSLCGLLLIAAISMNYFLTTYYNGSMAEYSTKKGLITELEDRVFALSSERLIMRPDNSQELDKLYALFEIYPNSWTPTLEGEASIGFKGEHIVITPTNAPVDPKFIKGVETTFQPDMSYQVRLIPNGDDTVDINGEG